MTQAININRRDFIDKTAGFIALSGGLLGLKACAESHSPSFYVDEQKISLIDFTTIKLDITPYHTLEEALGDEANIDWLNDAQRANAITLAYSAKEFQTHLEKINVKIIIAYKNCCNNEIQNDANHINLNILNTSSIDFNAAKLNLKNLGDEGYALVHAAGRISISANTRIGVLNGVYKYLQMLGFAWYDSLETTLPNNAKINASIAWKNLVEVPEIKYRGFWIYTKITDEYAIWLRRNRLNIGGLASVTVKNKLGLYNWAGGHDHIQEEFSKPGLFEANPSWFGLINGVRRPVAASGDYYNPNFANQDASNYFAAQIIKRLRDGDLKDIDILNIWPNDSRFNNFDQSDLAKNVGNETDNLLFFYLIVIKALANAYVEKKLNRIVAIFGISYYLTLKAPTNKKIINELEKLNFTNIFYPISRSWHGVISSDLDKKSSNKNYLNSLDSWRKTAKFDYGTVHYNNMSAYAGIALTDHKFFVQNLATTNGNKSALYGYMHPLLHNPGPRRLTNQLIANLGWGNAGESNADITKQEVYIHVSSNYFQNRYGRWAKDWQNLYDLVEQSVDNSHELFGDNGLFWLLFQKYIWPGPLFYTKAEIPALLQKYLTGGTQDLPAKFSGKESVTETFRGLLESTQIQQKARTEWLKILNGVDEPSVRSRMLDDVLWFESTLSRYRLMLNTSYYYLSVANNQEPTISKNLLQLDIDALKKSSTTKDAISPVDQRAFLKFHQMMVDDNTLF